MVPVHKPRCQKSSEKKLGWGDEIASQIYIYEITTCLFFLINCDMNSTLLPNSATLRKNNKQPTQGVFIRGVFSTTIWPGQVSFPWIWWRFFNPPGTLGFPQSTGGETETFRSETKRSCRRGAGFIIFIFFWLVQSICFKLRFLLFRHLSFVVCVLVCVLVFESWNYMKSMSKTKVETDWTVEPCSCFNLFSKWVDQKNNKRFLTHAVLCTTLSQ